MKLFGRCRKEGECICGQCELAPVNQVQTMEVRMPDGTIETRESPLINPGEYEAGTYHFNHEPALAARTAAKKEKEARASVPVPIIEPPAKPDFSAIIEKQHAGPKPVLPRPKKTMPPIEQQKRKRCPDCNTLLRKDHKCPALVDSDRQVLNTEPERPIIPPTTKTELITPPDRPNKPLKIAKALDLNDLRHEVVIQLAGLEIRIRPIEAT